MATWQPAGGAAACQPHVPRRVSPRSPRPPTFVLLWRRLTLLVESGHHRPQPCHGGLPWKAGSRGLVPVWGVPKGPEAGIGGTVGRGCPCRAPCTVGSRAEPPSGREGCQRSTELPLDPWKHHRCFSPPQEAWNMVGSGAVIQRTCYHHPGRAEPSPSRSPAVV